MHRYAQPSRQTGGPASTSRLGSGSGGPSKSYRGGRDPVTGTYFVLVRRGRERWLLRHGCRPTDKCLSPAGWTYGFGGAAATALARWMLIEALGLARLDDSVAYEAYATYMLPRWAERNWEVSEAEVHAWVATFLAADPACHECSEHGGSATCVCGWRMNWR